MIPLSVPTVLGLDRGFFVLTVVVMSTYDQGTGYGAVHNGSGTVRNEPLPSPASRRRELVRRLYGAVLKDSLHAGGRVTGALRHYTDLMDQMDMVVPTYRGDVYYGPAGTCVCDACRYCREHDDRAREERGSAEQAQLEEPNRSSAVILGRHTAPCIGIGCPRCDEIYGTTWPLPNRNSAQRSFFGELAEVNRRDADRRAYIKRCGK